MTDEHDESLSDYPLPPQDEFDLEGRHVHPYVSGEGMDYSAYGYDIAGGHVTQMDRSRESRITFHAIEPLLGHLTPTAAIYVIQSLIHRLYFPALAADLEARGYDREELDVRGELIPFEELHGPRLKAIYDAVEEILGVCPRCGRDHSGKNEGVLQPGPYVRSDTGEVVRVTRVAAKKVYSLAHHGEDIPAIDRIYERDWFEANFVPAGDVEVLHGKGA